MKLYTLKEVAAMLGITYLTVYKFAKEGKIKTITVGRFLRVTQEELDRITKEGV